MQLSQKLIQDLLARLWNSESCFLILSVCVASILIGGASLWRMEVLKYGTGYILGRAESSSGCDRVFQSLFRATYRDNLKGKIKSDLGFGCTVRAVQSLYINLVSGPVQEFRSGGSTNSSSEPSDVDVHAMHQSVPGPTLATTCLTTIEGTIDWDSSPFSYQAFTKAPGAKPFGFEWWGAAEACRVLVHLTTRLERSSVELPHAAHSALGMGKAQGDKAGGRASLPCAFIFAADGVVQEWAVRDAACGGGVGVEGVECDDDLWPRPVVVLLPVSLGQPGSDRKARMRQLVRLTASPAFGGAVGGRPRHSVCIVGCQLYEGYELEEALAQEGDLPLSFLCLDPHITQRCPDEPVCQCLPALSPRVCPHKEEVLASYACTLKPAPLGSTGTRMSPDALEHSMAVAVVLRGPKDSRLPELQPFLDVQSREGEREVQHHLASYSMDDGFCCIEKQ